MKRKFSKFGWAPTKAWIRTGSIRVHVDFIDLSQWISFTISRLASKTTLHELLSFNHLRSEGKSGWIQIVEKMHFAHFPFILSSKAEQFTMSSHTSWASISGNLPQTFVVSSKLRENRRKRKKSSWSIINSTHYPACSVERIHTTQKTLQRVSMEKNGMKAESHLNFPATPSYASRKCFRHRKRNFRGTMETGWSGNCYHTMHAAAAAAIQILFSGTLTFVKHTLRKYANDSRHWCYFLSAQPYPIQLDLKLLFFEQCKVVMFNFVG